MLPARNRLRNGVTPIPPATHNCDATDDRSARKLPKPPCTRAATPGWMDCMHRVQSPSALTPMRR